ncbi:conserved hypothetical protein [Methylovorus sp. MP688]|nr:conserved hypothetical protein [Methylovorus sp. MP688]
MAVSLLIYSADMQTWLAHFLFYANYPPKPFIPHITEHMWSLCVEIHFYLGVALLVALLKKKGLLLIPILCVLITLLRLSQGMYSSVITHFRVDEILTGATLALVLGGHLGNKVRDLMTRTNFWLIAILLLISCHPSGGPLNYLRPYFAALLVGISLTNPDKLYTRFLYHRWLFYVASISYALYVVHPLLADTWLGTGDTLLEKYMKRPLLFAAIFLVAHISTKYYEGPAMRLGKSLSERWGKKSKPVADQVSQNGDKINIS